MTHKIKEILLSGRLRTADDPTTIKPEDFQVLTNMHYNNTHPYDVTTKTNPVTPPPDFIPAAPQGVKVVGGSILR